MAEIIKVYRESLPSLRLIGKRYTDKDRGTDGSFGNKWREWFGKGKVILDYCIYVKR